MLLVKLFGGLLPADRFQYDHMLFNAVVVGLFNYIMPLLVWQICKEHFAEFVLLHRLLEFRRKRIFTGEPVGITLRFIPVHSVLIR